MMEKLAYLWDTIRFYGPAAGSILYVSASGIAVLVIWHFIRKSRKRRKDADKNDETSPRP